MKHLRVQDGKLHQYRPVIYRASMEANFRWTTTVILVFGKDNLGVSLETTVQPVRYWISSFIEHDAQHSSINRRQFLRGTLCPLPAGLG